MGRAFVIGDVHGDVGLLRGLLRQAGLVDGRGARTDPDTLIVQVGDLCNCVPEDRDGDLACLAKAPKWLDVYLVGNHEHPYFGGPRFSGFYSFTEIQERLRALDKTGLIRPCLLVDGILISHAGVGRQWNDLGGAERTAKQIDEWWREAPATAPIFADIGASRGGWARAGGVFWADADEPKTTSFSQIIGHTPQRNGVRVDRLNEKHSVWHIDVGGHHFGRLAGVFVADGDVSEPVVFEKKRAAA